MLIDCDSCAVRGRACRDCIVNVLLGMPTVRPADHGVEQEPGLARRVGPVRAARAGFELEQDEQDAIAVLAGAGLVPPLRLVVRPVDPQDSGEANWHHEPDASGAGTSDQCGDAVSRTGRRAVG